MAKPSGCLIDPILWVAPSKASSSDPARLSATTLSRAAFAANPGTVNGFEDRALAALLATQLGADQLHSLLARVLRPDVDNLPALIVTGGYMMPGRFKGKRNAHIGFVSELYSDWKEGRLPDADYQQLNECVCPTVGACAMMGTANTFCCMTEALGMSLPGNGTTAAVESGLHRLAHQAGRQVVRLVEENIRPRDIMTREAVANAMKVHSAIGGSTNALLHVPAIANELGFEIPLADWDEIAREVPHLANITTGSEFTMDDFANAGGVQAVMHELGDRYSVVGTYVPRLGLNMVCFSVLCIY